MKPFRATRRIEFCDTDMAGMVHFANFFRFMEFAEQEFLRARGLSVASNEGGRRIGFPRRAAQCDYLKPVKFEDVIEIEVVIDRIGLKSITYSFRFYRGSDEVAKGHITTVCCQPRAGGGIEAIDIPDDIRAKLSAP